MVKNIMLKLKSSNIEIVNCRRHGCGAGNGGAAALARASHIQAVAAHGEDGHARQLGWCVLRGTRDGGVSATDQAPHDGRGRRRC